MPPIKSILIPSGGMNQDDSPITPPPGSGAHSLFESGDYRYAKNAHIGSTNENNEGALENFPSTLPVEYGLAWNGSEFIATTAPDGTNVVIGRYEDETLGHLYVVVYNSNQEHLIYRFDKNTHASYEMLRWSGWNFAETNRISLAKIDKYLLITCNEAGFNGDRNPPRIIDVSDGDNAIYKLWLTLTTNFQEYHISFAKWAPVSPPIPRRNLVGQGEYVKKGIYQFCYRYVYKGGFKTTFSPPSWFVTNEINGDDYTINLMIPGFLYKYNDPSNTAFQHNNVAFYEFVEFIELAYRESSIDAWKIFKSHAVSGVANNQYFDFSNTGPSSRVPSIEIAQPFDSVPFFSGAVEAIDNRPMLGDNDDDLTPIADFDITDIEVYSSSYAIPNWNGPQANFTGLTFPQRVELDRIFSTRQFSFKENGVYKLAIVCQHFTGRTWLAQTLDKWTYLTPANENPLGSGPSTIYAFGFKIPLTVVPPLEAVSYMIVRSNCLNHEFFIYGVVNNIKFLANDTNNMNDEIETPDSISGAVSGYYDSFNPASSDDPLSSRVLSATRKSREVTNFSNCAWVYLEISNWMLSSKGDAGGTVENASNNIFYNFQKGDRVRLRCGTNASAPITTYNLFDEEILEFTGKGIIIAKPTGATLMFTRAQIVSLFPQLLYQIEIYRPKKVNQDSEVIFYTMGEWYPISQPGTASRDFVKRDFTWGGTSLVTQTTFMGQVIYHRMPIVSGDVWVVTKPFYYTYFNAVQNGSDNTRWIQMNQDKTQAAGVWDHNNGRPFVAYKYATPIIEKPTQIRFGLKFLQDGSFNSINTFRDENQFIYPTEYGRIRALINTSNAQVESVGNILLALGEETAWSIYVNRTTLEDLSGRTQVGVSDKVLGSFNTLLGNYGTLNPESASRRNGRVTYWSQRHGTWIRYSRDGATPISENKMKTWFKDLSDLLADGYNGTVPIVLSTYDNFHDYWLTSLNHADMPEEFRGYEVYKCVSFSERDKRWKSSWEYLPERFASLDNDVYMLIGTTVHILERGDDYNSIVGTEVTTDWEPIANAMAKNSKSWQSIDLIAQDRWEFTSIKGDPKSVGTIQETRILAARLEQREGKYVATIPNDLNTPNMTTDEAIVNGNKMRSRALSLYMVLDVRYQSILNGLTVIAIDSPKN